MSPAALAWVHRVSVLVHVSGVVVWMGAVAYHLFVLQPALKATEIDRPTRYVILRAIKRRTRVVVAWAIVAIVVSGLVNAWLRGLLGNGASPDASRAFAIKMGVVATLILIFLFALGMLKRVKEPRLRGRLFTAVHVVVLVLGAVAAGIGIYLAG